LIGDLLENSLKWIDVAMKVPKEEKHFTEGHVTAVLLVGGSTRVPLVRRLLEQRFGKERVRGQECGINPDEIVALGAAIVAADEDPDNVEVAPKTLIDVTGHTLSVAALDQRTGREELCPIIHKETAIPCKGFHEFATMGNFQESCRIRVFQGEGKEIDPRFVTMIGEFEITIPRLRESIPLKVDLDLDGNGILVAHATEGKNGQRVDCTLVYKDSAQLSPEDLERKRAALEATLNAQHRHADNPLRDGDGFAGGGRGYEQYGTPAASTPAPTNAGASMNPIMRKLFDKALASFDRVPADRQAALYQLVGEIESAANAADQARLTAYFPQLQKLMEGVA
jgi:molecular chaperone DnaK (HSP70)